MTSGFQPYLISEFKSGINTYLQPWIRPKEAFDPMLNAYVYRGVVQKRTGYLSFGDRVPDGNPIMGIMRYIDQISGNNFLLIGTTRNLYIFVDPDYVVLTLPAAFTGKINNFFNYTNWQPTISSASLIIMTNNVDPVTFYDGSGPPGGVTQPTLWLDAAHTNQISTCLDVKVYKQRLLYIRTTISGTSPGVENQTIHWSAVSAPTNTIIGNSSGSAGFLAAPTGDVIQSSEFLRDQLVVYFTNSTWIFRYTGNDTQPFRWDKINNSKSTTAPYGAIDYDERCTSVGNTGLIASDGVNVQRYDLSIVDYYEVNFSQKYFAQTFGQRYDNLSQGWMLYVSQQNKFPILDDTAPGSDRALIYNFIEDTWATYTWSDPLTCLGTYFAQTDTRWQNLQQAWNVTPQSWNAYQAQKGALLLLAGDTTGNVYQMDQPSSLTDDGADIVPQIKSTQWNPVMQAGQKTQFGHIDIYYTIPETNSTSLQLNFYLDGNESPATSRTLTIGPSGPSQNAKSNFQRVYINLVGQFVSMEIVENTISQAASNPFFKLLGFILWARPAGRLNPGLTLS